MIIVHGTIPIKSECRDDALKLARRMSELTQQESGCLSYDFYVGLRDPDTLVLFQEWESMDALMNHFQTPHMEEFLQALPEVLAGEITTRRYAVQNLDEETEQPEEGPRIIH